MDKKVVFNEEDFNMLFVMQSRDNLVRNIKEFGIEVSDRTKSMNLVVDLNDTEYFRFASRTNSTFKDGITQDLFEILNVLCHDVASLRNDEHREVAVQLSSVLFGMKLREHIPGTGMGLLSLH